MTTRERTKAGITTDIQSDKRGGWYVWCDACEGLLGDAVPYSMALEKRRNHEAQHINTEEVTQ